MQRQKNASDADRQSAPIQVMLHLDGHMSTDIYGRERAACRTKVLLEKLSAIEDRGQTDRVTSLPRPPQHDNKTFNDLDLDL